MQLLLFILTWFSLGTGDGNTRTLIRTKHDQFRVDNIGNVYTVNREELLKFQPSGKLFARYSNLRLGAITMADPSNPLKILVYYRDFQQLVFLDNQLSVNSDVVSLERLGLEQTELVCASSNNGFWVYNKQNNELIRFNESSQRTASTGNLKLILNAELTPAFMLEHNNLLYLSSPASGIFVFDIFGTFIRVVPIKGLTTFQVGNNMLYFQRDSALCSYDQKLLQENCAALPQKRGQAAWSPAGVYQSMKDSILVTPL